MITRNPGCDSPGRLDPLRESSKDWEIDQAQAARSTFP